MGDDQIVAIRDFIFSIDEKARLPEAGKEVGSPLVTGQSAEGEGAAGPDEKGAAKDDKDKKGDKNDKGDKKPDDKKVKPKGAASGNPPAPPKP